METLLAETADHLVEYHGRLLTIARYSDGRCLSFTGPRVAGEFRDCLETHSPERVIRTYIRMAKGMRGRSPSWQHADADGWTPLYKPERMPRAAAAQNAA